MQSKHRKTTKQDSKTYLKFESNSSKRKDILRVAIRLFSTHNFSIGIDQIIKESNVAKMTFYKYFPAKKCLIEECILMEITSEKETILGLLKSLGETDSHHKIKTIFQWHVLKNKQQSLIRKAQIELIQSNLSSNRLIFEHKIWKHELLETIFKDMLVKDPCALAALYMTLFEGISVQRFGDKINQIDERAFKILCQSYFRSP